MAKLGFSHLKKKMVLQQRVACYLLYIELCCINIYVCQFLKDLPRQSGIKEKL